MKSPETEVDFKTQIIDTSVLDKILSAVENVSTSVSSLSERVSQLESNKPKVVHQRVNEESVDKRRGTYTPPEEIRKRGMKSLSKAGQQTVGGVRGLDSPDMVAMLPPEYRPVFQSGDLVRVNPEANVYGTEDDKDGPRKWGPILDKLGIDGVGEVLAVQGLTRSWEPKYTVHVPGLTKTTGTGIREGELLPYDG